MIERTEAIILSTRRYSESSKIVTLYTRSLGKLAVMARGAMRPKSKFGGVIQPLSVIEVTVYMKQGRDLQTLSDAERLIRFPLLTRELDRMTAALEIVELLNATVHEPEQNLQLFEETVRVFQLLDRPETDPDMAVVLYMKRLALLLGYGLRTSGCGICDEEVTPEEEGVPYSIATGAPLCSEHRAVASYRYITREGYGILSGLDQDDREVDLSRQAYSGKPVIAELRDVLNGFFRYHVDGLRKLKVGGVALSISTPDETRSEERRSSAAAPSGHDRETEWSEPFDR